MTHRARVIAVLVVGPLLCLLIISWPVAAHYRAEARLERYRTKLRAEGEKMAIAELAPTLLSADISAANTLERTSVQMPLISSNSIPLMRLTSPGRALVAWEQEI